MEPPPSIALGHEFEWICKESALVAWNDPDRLEISSLGLPCPTGKPTQITLWVGKHLAKELCIMLQLRISARFSKRRKVLDYYLILPPPTGSTSIMNVDDASQDVRECLKDAYGKSSTKKCIRVLFQLSEPGRVLMPSAPENAPCFGGTPFHLLTQFRSLSRASKIDVYIGYSSYAQHALMNLEPLLENISTCAEYVDLPRSYGGNGGVFDDWRQIGDKPPNHFSDAQQPLLDLNQKGRENNQTRLGTSPSAETRRPLITEVYGVLEHDRLTGPQATCSPPPYSPPRRSVPTSVTSKSRRISKFQSSSPGCLKRPRDSNSPENEPCTKSAKSHSMIDPFSSTVPNASSIVQNTQSPLTRRLSPYSPTVANTPSTVEDPQLISLQHITPTRGGHHSSSVSPKQRLASSHHSASRSRTRHSTVTEEGGSSAGDLLDFNRGKLGPSTSTNSSSPETPRIKPTVFASRLEFLSVPNDVEDTALLLEQKQPTEKTAGSFTSTQRSLDHISPSKTSHPLNKALKALVAAQSPPLTTEALQHLMDDLLESVDYSHRVAEIGLQETSDEFKAELQLEKDKGVEEITEHAEDILAGVKYQMEDLADGHLISFEDMLQQTNEQLQQTLKGFLGGLIRAMTMGKGCFDRRAAEDTKVAAPLVQDQTPVCKVARASSMPDSSAVAATKLFLREFGDLQATTKVKVLERLTSQSTAEVFLTVDRELREAWVASWTGATLLQT